MNPFCLLRDPETYVAHDYEMVADETLRDHWLKLFAEHFEDTLEHALRRYGRTVRKKAEAARERFLGIIKTLETDPTALPGGKLNVMELCRLREKTLREHDLGDPFKHVKDRENAAAVELYPPLVHERHPMEPDAKWIELIRSVFAGNIFDLGSPATMNLAHESPDFHGTLERIKERPWLVDDFDRLLEDLPHSPPARWTKAIIFIDNAGSDFVLGIMPLVRELALAGTQIVLAANELPTLNDMTIDETIEVVDYLAGIDGDLAALIDGQMFQIVSSGNDLPLIDLSRVADELNETATDADLVVLEGMGRAIESNFDAQFSVDCIKIALLKDPMVAAKVGGDVFDCVCKYEPIVA